MRDDGQIGGTAGDPFRGDLRALILVEIQAFPGLRRQLGVARAELLASEIAERAAALLPCSTVATVGRNLIELVIPIDDVGGVAAAVATLEAGAAQPLIVYDAPVPLALCIGSAVGAGSDHLALIEAAESSLAAARVSGCTAAAPATILPDSTIGAELRAAVTRDELFLQYQPKLHLRRQAITSVEALIRWRHPERGLVMPGDFIPAAERTGAIEAMTLWTLRQVIADQRVLGRNGHDLPIFINIAGALLSNRAFIDQTCALVRESGAKLGFEITETSVIREPARAIDHLQRLADIGVAITIDDYGAGLSSLAYLKQLPARELKIDKLFVTQLSSSHRDPLIVRSTIDLAHALEMEVVAEGVETPTSLALLSVMGCDMVQGFLIARPLALEALLIYLRDETHRTIVEQSRSPLQRLAAVRARA